MRTGLNTVYVADGVDLGDHVDTWEGEDGIAYGYDAAEIHDATTPTGAAVVNSNSGRVEVGDLVRVENIPRGHRHHTHRQWAVGPVKSIWAVPRDQEESDEGDRVETVELDPREYDPDAPEDWPGVAIACEVYAPRLGGDTPIGQCQPVDEPPALYVERFGDDRSEGLWVNEPIRKDEQPFNNDHLPDPEEDDRDPDLIGTDGDYHDLREMRREMYLLPADDANADPDNPETPRPYQITVHDDHLEVELLDGNGEERMRSVAADHDATVTHVETEERGGGFGAADKQTYRVSFDG